MRQEFVTTTVNLFKEQNEFIKCHNKNHIFSLSKFVRLKLDEYIKFMKDLERDKEEMKNEKKII